MKPRQPRFSVFRLGCCSRRPSPAASCATRPTLLVDKNLRTVEAQNRSELRSKTATLSGKPDIIALREDEAVIVDAKTGHESRSHTVQVMIYLYAVPKASERYRNAKLRGQVTYRDHTTRIPADAVDDQFVQNLGALIRRLSADEPARRVPSQQECRFCDISAADCPVRVGEASEPDAGETADF